MAFVHLHTHSEYSLLDGANRIPELLDRIHALGMDSLAITDHGNLHGAWQFHAEARAGKLRPIRGFEAYLAFGSRHKRERPPDAPAASSHLVLLAKTRTGYRHLVKLSSIGFLEGYYRRPRIDREALEQYGEGLIGLAACLSGEIALYLRQGNYEAAKASAQYFARLFGPDGFWLEVQNHGIADERTVTAGMFQLAAELGLPIVATNDAHYLKKEDAEAHDVLLAIGTGKDLDDPNRFRFFGQESYVKSEPEMRSLFPDRPEVLAETARVAELCEFDFEKRYFLPQYPRPAAFASDNDLLVHLARAGALARYGDPLPDAAAQRLDYELGVISRTGYAGYFLIVYDIVKAAKDRGIPVGPGRGSAAGSLVAYALGITDIDPLKFDLLFERFLNPERVSMPDIDLDFCFERRGEVIQYIRERYGRDSVAQIVAFGTLKGKQAIKDVGRVLGFNFAETDRVAKLYPAPKQGKDYPLEKALEMEPRLREVRDAGAREKELFDNALKLEGLFRQTTKHASGIVISNRPLVEDVPLFLDPDQLLLTQYAYNEIDAIGLIKFDFLGLKTLTLIESAVRGVREGKAIELDLSAAPLDDKRTYEMLGRGDTVGIFQMESGGMRKLLTDLRPTCFEDLIAVNALYRPGPLDSGMLDQFIKRKRGKEPIRYLHPALEPVLKETYGVIVYQEQVMKIAQELAGYTLGDADNLRRAMGKKKAEEMAVERVRFLDGGSKQGMKAELAGEIFDQMETFAAYGFNKSHSAAYSLVSFQTAYLKAH